MKYCEKCNLDFPQPFQFCGSCGGALSETHTCSTCGQLTELKWPFCTKCGSQLSSETFKPLTTIGSGLPMAAVASTFNQEREYSRALTNELLSNNIGRSSKSEEWYRADLSQESTITKHSAGSLRFDVQDQESSHQLATKDASVREAKAPPLLSIMESYGHASEIPT